MAISSSVSALTESISTTDEDGGMRLVKFNVRRLAVQSAEWFSNVANR
jgi:hypothetical protein